MGSKRGNAMLNSNRQMSRNLKVLVVDDSAEVREAARSFLSDAGFIVLTAKDGFEGLAVFTQDVPDVVMADIMMPRVDGYQMCTLIKSHPDYSCIPVIMLSGKDALLDEHRAALAGSEFCINKPFSALAITGVAREYGVRSVSDALQDSEMQPA